MEQPADAAGHRGAVAVVPLEGRGDLPFALLHRRPLLDHVLRTVTAVPGLAGVAGVVVTAEPGQRDRATATAAAGAHRVPVEDAADWWAVRAGRDPGRTGPVVLLDPLCPLVPTDLVAKVLAAGSAAAAYRPVTDTVKTVVDQQISGTLDRDALAIVTSPVLLPAGRDHRGRPPTEDFAALVAWLRERGEVALVKAPSMARRVADESAVQVLECLDELAHRVREA